MTERDDILPGLYKGEAQPLLDPGRADCTVRIHKVQGTTPTTRRRVTRLTCGYCTGFFVIAALIMGAIYPLLPGAITETAVKTHVLPSSTSRDVYVNVPSCKDGPCFRPEATTVRKDREGFPSYWNYAGPMNVTYDKRSFMINGDRALFLSGSMHPVRATPNTWNLALDEAVRNGLNMITIYVMWSAHQPFPGAPIDWRLPNHRHDCPDCEWTLASAIQAVANRGLFVHIRVGPYVCAEYTYGGIPPWLALKYPNMDMRRPNAEWMALMKAYVSAAVGYFRENQLWADQGGPIILAQIENELGGEVNATTENIMCIDNAGNFVVDCDDDSVSLRRATLQDYANWCGEVGNELAPYAIWTMCNGMSANNTIDTFNGDWGLTDWLEHFGDSNEVQRRFPAMWTEDEGGFQIWGDESNRASDYFWGRPARDMTYDALRWFARGGTHLNYYMWWGGYNMGLSAAAGITNMYASDVCLCSSGERRQPKFDHFESLHGALVDVAPSLLHSESALLKNESVQFMSDSGAWAVATEQILFRYGGKRVRGSTDEMSEALFVENNSDRSHVVRFAVLNGEEERIIELQPYSALLFKDGSMIFDSAALKPRAVSFARKVMRDPVKLLDWSSWSEPVGASASDPMSHQDGRPIEQTALNMEASILSDFAWYETDIAVSTDLPSGALHIETQQANAMIVYIDDVYVGSADTHKHQEGNANLTVELGQVAAGSHSLSILSESLGYGNQIGHWGGSTKAKLKGLIGDVQLSCFASNISAELVDGRPWRSLAGLNGERRAANSIVRRDSLARNLRTYSGSGPRWSSALFDTPRYDSTSQRLFVELVEGRGHLWLNGVDLGRYWNITRGSTSEYSQQFYFLPPDVLYDDGRLNELVIFDVFGWSSVLPRLLLSWIQPSDVQFFRDEVDFPLACL